jgi:hypothetical protein
MPTSQWDYDVLIQEWDLDGNCQASLCVSTDGEHDDYANDIHVDGSGVHVPGHTYNIGTENPDRYDCDALWVTANHALDEVECMWRSGDESSEDAQLFMTDSALAAEGCYVMIDNAWDESVHLGNSQCRITLVTDDPADSQCYLITVAGCSVQISGGAMDGEGCAHLAGSCTDADGHQEALMLGLDCTQSDPAEMCKYANEWSLDEELYAECTGAACDEDNVFFCGQTGEVDPDFGLPMTSDPIALAYCDDTGHCQARLSVGAPSYPGYVAGCAMQPMEGDSDRPAMAGWSADDSCLEWVTNVGRCEPIRDEDLELTCVERELVDLTEECQCSGITGTLIDVTSQMTCDITDNPFLTFLFFDCAP